MHTVAIGHIGSKRTSFCKAKYSSYCSACLVSPSRLFPCPWQPVEPVRRRVAVQLLVLLFFATDHRLHYKRQQTPFRWRSRSRMLPLSCFPKKVGSALPDNGGGSWQSRLPRITSQGALSTTRNVECLVDGQLSHFHVNSLNPIAGEVSLLILALRPPLNRAHGF